MRLHHAVTKKLVFDDLLLNDLLREFELIHDVNEVALREEVAGSTSAGAFDSLGPALLVLKQLF